MKCDSLTGGDGAVIVQDSSRWQNLFLFFIMGADLKIIIIYIHLSSSIPTDEVPEVHSTRLAGVVLPFSGSGEGRVTLSRDPRRP